MPGKDTQLKNAVQNLENDTLNPSIPSTIPLDETHLFGNDQKLLNFALNDSLGLSFHPTLQKNGIKFLLQHGHGSTLSLGQSAYRSLVRKIEMKIARTFDFPEALLFPSRLSAHTALFPTLATTQSLILIDRSAHHTMRHAAFFSRAHVELFSHNDLTHLKTLLEETRNLSYFTKIIATETLFSTLGDLAPLSELASLAEEYKALLYVDDTHSLGTHGKGGTGLGSRQKGIDLAVGALDHGLGAALTFAGCSETTYSYLQEFCTALKENSLPIPSLGLIDATLDLLPSLEGERKQLNQRAYFLRTRLQELGFDIGETTTHLIPLFLKSNTQTLHYCQALIKKQIVAQPLLTPQVAKPTLLFSLSAHHTPEHLSSLLSALESILSERELLSFLHHN